MEELKYIIEDSTIAELLGVQNFSSDEAAILELVKNAYDAKALDLRIEFSGNTLFISDDGVGMNDSDIKKHWMHIGKSNKEYEIVDSNNHKRIQAGSKGVGRFALSRLGKEIEIQSRKENERGVVWKTDWNKSILDEKNVDILHGTKIKIGNLREKWTSKRIENLGKYLEKTYNDTAMKIEVVFGDNCILVPCHFPKPEPGINCRSNIVLDYSEGKLTTTIFTDEFSEEAEKYCNGMDLHYYSIETNMEEELKGVDLPELDEELLGQQLNEIGHFSANFFFNLNSSKLDKEKFLYKYTETPNSVEEGIILYRNAFSISSYEGKKDWLGLGKRSRKSPAAATHPTGSWRVRENQLAGYVQIDKRANYLLRDLANRQGLDENIYYILFIEIILAGVKEFERYRQSIIRKINEKNNLEEEKPTPISEKVVKNPLFVKSLSDTEARQLKQEIAIIQKEGKQAKQERKEVEARYKYDVRILNVLATTGLKASSIAHELKNDRNDLYEIYNNIVESLKEYEMWDTLSRPENTRKVYRNVPYMLDKNYEVSKKLVVFMDTMLAEIEKRQFDIKMQNIRELVERIKMTWLRDYGWLSITADIDSSLEFALSEDVMRVILDNLILNSVQQNDNMPHLQIYIEIKKQAGMLLVRYRDLGQGLNKKYENNPMKILEVHETTRTNGHGLGMWIVNNTVVMSGGEITEIKGDKGFEISLSIGGKYAGR
ncbi:MAG: sensor histidine kinase [Lachnospiraceae bacterium]|nr:sensor histidine kinase [Lachnospiraceae bacterium]